MSLIIRCCACDRVLLTKAAGERDDQFGFGPYADFMLLPGVKLRLYVLAEQPGLVCPYDGRVTWIKAENVESLHAIVKQ